MSQIASTFNGTHSPTALIAASIRARRDALGLTQRDVAERMEALLSKPFEARNVSRYERAANAPTGRNLSAIAEALQTTVPELLGVKPKPGDDELRRELRKIDRRLARIERLLEG